MTPTEYAIYVETRADLAVEIENVIAVQSHPLNNPAISRVAAICRRVRAEFDRADKTPTPQPELHAVTQYGYRNGTGGEHWATHDGMGAIFAKAASADSARHYLGQAIQRTVYVGPTEDVA